MGGIKEARQKANGLLAGIRSYGKCGMTFESDLMAPLQGMRCFVDQWGFYNVMQKFDESVLLTLLTVMTQIKGHSHTTGSSIDHFNYLTFYLVKT